LSEENKNSFPPTLFLFGKQTGFFFASIFHVKHFEETHHKSQHERDKYYTLEKE
jgi:hypothetical protein